MKHILIILFSLSFPGLLHAAEQTVILSVPRMDCPVCPIAIKKSLQRVDGVNSVNVVYESKTATVSFNDEVTNINSLQKATKNVGYPSHLQVGNE